MAMGDLGPGWVWLYPGKSNPYGVTVSTRTAYNVLSGQTLTVRQVNTATHAGLSYERRREMMAKPQSESVLRRYLEKRAEEGQPITRQQALAPGSEFWGIEAALQNPDNSPTGVKAFALTKITRGRQDGWNWNVGETL